MLNKFKDEKGRWLTQALFLEKNMSPDTNNNPLFTLRHRDDTNLPCLKDLYLEFKDPSEYLVATHCFGGWAHWQVLCKTTWFKPIVEGWRMELEAMFRYEALQKIQGHANPLAWRQQCDKGQKKY
jgi:hypothetical protein